MNSRRLEGKGETCVEIEVQAASTSRRRNPYRVLNAITFIACAVGFTYQANEFIQEYYKYPSVIDIQVEQPNLYQIPSYTFCNTNRVMRSKYCAKYPDNCESPSDMEAFCASKPHYCKGDLTNFTVPKASIISDNIPLTEVEELGHNISGFIIANGYDEQDIDGPFYYDIKSWSAYPCYSLNSRFESPLESREWRSHNYHKGSNSFAKWGSYYLDVEAHEMFHTEDEPGALMTIHSPFRPENPQFKSIFMRPGKRYIVNVRMEEQHLLPYPYQTDCIDYNVLWLTNNRTGPRSANMCIERCHTKFDISCYGCATMKSIYANITQLCSKENISDKVNKGCDDYIKHLNDLGFCIQHCKKECLSIKYFYTFSETTLSNVGRYSFGGDRIEIDVFTDGEGIQVLTHKPRYMAVEFFSYIGGFIGMWLGISIWAVTGYMKQIFSYMKTFIKRKISD